MGPQQFISVRPHGEGGTTSTQAQTEGNFGDLKTMVHVHTFPAWERAESQQWGEQSLSRRGSAVVLPAATPARRPSPTMAIHKVSLAGQTLYEVAAMRVRPGQGSQGGIFAERDGQGHRQPQ